MGSTRADYLLGYQNYIVTAQKYKFLYLSAE
jgi:hypothetical protein